MNQTAKVVTVTLNPAIDQTVNIPNFKADQGNRVKREQLDAGGKGVNVASVLADYGFSVAATGFLGAENISIFEQLFTRKQIDDRFVRIDGRTRTGIKIIDEVHHETTDINFPGQAPTEANITKLLAGSIPAGVPVDIYRQLVGLINNKDRAVALDTSGKALKLALPGGPTLIKPNFDELRELTGSSLNSQSRVVQAAQRLLKRGIETVIVSMGTQGAIFVEADKVVLARPPEVTVKSTVGAGDAMVSGTVAGKIQGLSLEDCARLATAFSLTAITQVGSGIPSIETVEDFKRQVTLEQLS